ncbi:MAG TPA: hypothetical protein VKX17_17990 [Planctomycetota bacterium]|nr:hypothetical protein [Planctomycetota bacterium]
MDTASTISFDQVPVLLRGESVPIAAWVERWSTRRVLLYVSVIFMGAGLYGASMGWWRDPRQALYVAIKFPLIILLTTLGNALLNGMLAPLLGLNLRFTQSLQAILMSFTIASAILGAFSPLIGFLVWNVQPMRPGAQIPVQTYLSIQLTHVTAIAFAGVAANLRLMQLLNRLSSNASAARRVLFSWLAGNLFLGSQLVWILRPFIGSPFLEVQFLRPNAFQGNFYESVYYSIRHLIAIGGAALLPP